MMKNLAITFLSILLVLVSVVSLLAINGILADKHRLDEENAQNKKYFADIEAWKTCILDSKIIAIDSEKYVKLSELQECSK